MVQKVLQWRLGRRRWRVLPLFIALVFLSATLLQNPASAASTRLQMRSLFMRSTVPGDVTDYTFTWNYISPQPVGSIVLDFCDNPYPYMACNLPQGMDIGAAQLGSQTGETGFTITIQTATRIILSRPPSTVTADAQASYTFTGIKNPTDITAFAIRIQTYDQAGGVGNKGDFGGVRGSSTTPVTIQTQVPPMLIFCLAQQVELNCVNSNEVYATKLGELKPNETLSATSQMAVGTNASGGFAITVDGIPLAAGTNVIDAMAFPALSQQGKNQFGINLVANTAPEVGEDPFGVWANAQPTADYGTPNLFKYQSGDIIASSPNVSLMKKFTVSYIVNTRANLKPGIYATTITFIASGRF